MQKVILTGSSGFIGSNIFYDLKKKYIFNLLDRKDLDLIFKNKDIKKINKIKKEIDNADVLIHCAGLAHKPKYTFNNNSINQINVELTISLFKLISSLNVKKFIYISTAKVMGDSNINFDPFNEDQLPNPMDIYSFSKYEAEKKLIKLCKSSKIELIIIRPPLIYGPGVKGNFLKLIKYIDNQNYLPLSNKKNMRSYLSTKNLSSAIDTIVNCRLDKVNIFFICDDENLSLKELSKKIAKYLYKKNNFIKIPDFIIEYIIKIISKNTYNKLFSSFNLDNSFFKKKTGWQAFKNDDTLQKTIDYYKKNDL